MHYASEFDFGQGLTELKGTVVPWRRYAIYGVPFHSGCL